MTTLALTNFLAKYFFVEQILFMYDHCIASISYLIGPLG